MRHNRKEVEMALQSILSEPVPVPDVEWAEGDHILWNANPRPEQRITLVNEGDLDLGRLFRRIGIQDSPLRSSFGIADVVEIGRRHELVRFLLAKPKMRDALRSLAVRHLPRKDSDKPTE